MRVYRLVSFVSSLIGLGISAFLLKPESVESTVLCTVGGSFSCSAVLNSPFSYVYDVPISALGVVWFTVAAVLSYYSEARLRAVKLLLAWSILGLASIAYLIYIELFQIRALCTYCTMAHITGAVVFAAAYLLYARMKSKYE